MTPRTEESRKEGRTGSGPVVLIVDDDPSVRRALRTALRDERYQVDELEDGMEITGGVPLR